MDSSLSFDSHPFLDMENQRCLVDHHHRQHHEAWCNAHVAAGKLDHDASRVRALVLVNEAWRNEKIHLGHQLAHCRRVLGLAPKAPSPPNGAVHSGECACLRAPVHRQLSAKYRAMNLVARHFPESKLEQAVESLRQTYTNDHEMIGDLLFRYGPEPAGPPNPRLWLRSVEERLKTCDSRWRAIGNQVKMEMMYRDAFPIVIRNLSIMRIFLEGSQAATYSCDPSERSRRDQYHQDVLDRLAETGALFVPPS